MTRNSKSRHFFWPNLISEATLIFPSKFGVVKKVATKSRVQLWFRYVFPAMCGHYLAFFAGIMFMIFYYLWFHPTGGIDIPWSLFGDKKKSLDTETKVRKNSKEIEMKVVMIRENRVVADLNVETPVAHVAGTGGSEQVIWFMPVIGHLVQSLCSYLCTIYN